MQKFIIGLVVLLSFVINSYSQDQKEDFLTPKYYLSDEDADFRKEVNQFVHFARQVFFQHPLLDSDGNSPDFATPAFGTFGAGKGPTRTQQHHPAIDFRVGARETNVNIYAAHYGIVNIYRNAPKYRHYISISTDVKNDAGNTLGKMVTIYGHVDLDLDSLQQILPVGKLVKRGEIISKNLYSGTRGGPHLHFEIRYYRPNDKGDEEFYGFKRPDGSGNFSQPTAGEWSYGVWNPNIGYGYGNPKNHLNIN